MTKKTKKSVAAGWALLTVLLLASCTHDDALPGDNTGGLPALGLNVLQAKDLSEVATRAATASVYPTDKFIGFFVKENTANGYAACDNRKGEYNASRKLWLPVPDSIWLNNHDADIAVYAPYDATQTTAATLNLAACLRPADGSKDLWCKHFTANNKSTGLAPVLEHVYTRFTISMKLDANYKGMAPVDSVSLTGTDLYAVGVYQPFETTAYTYAGDAGVGFMLPSKINLTTASSTGSIDLLLIPATLTGDIKLSLTVNGITFGATLASSSFGGKLEAGKQYNASITLKPTALEVTSVTINDWDDVTVSGEYEPVFVPQPEPIDIGLDFLIAWGNLRATKPAGSSTYEYFFAKEQGYYSGIKDAEYNPAGGDYFCWNTLDPEVTDAYYQSWDDARDPCRKVADGSWHTPSKDQLQALVDLYTDKKAIWGTYAMKEKEGSTPVNGVYFGTSSVPNEADQDKYLFLPAAGHRSYTGNWLDVGSGGTYWSNEMDSYGLTLIFYNAYGFRVDLQGSGNENDCGQPLRCVKDKPKSKPEHAIEVEGLDFYVADANVRAIKQADNTYKYDFAENQGDYSGVNGVVYDHDPAKNDYFCWNTLDPVARYTTNSTNVWNNNDDPCRKIEGGQWYTPTQAQLQALVDAKHIWGTYTKNSKTVTGRYFGIFPSTTIAPGEADQDKYVFLPAAGGPDRDDSLGTIINEGSYGYYWSSTPRPNDSGSPNALYFDSSTVDGAYYGALDASYSVRCVHDK